jgi:hypothetical protein
MYPCRAKYCKKGMLKREEDKYYCPDCKSIFSITWIQKDYIKNIIEQIKEILMKNKRTKCKRGHSLINSDNIYIRPNGIKNCKMCIKINRIERYKRKKLTITQVQNQWRKKHPWYSHYNSAKTRCNNIKSNVYKYYGNKGIKFLMTMEDFKTLWYRDKAYNMKRPSIDRKDSSGNYELSNCRFIEITLNDSLAHRKLTEIQVLDIRKLYKTGNYTQKELGKKYNVIHQAISNIINNKIWKYI